MLAFTNNISKYLLSRDGVVMLLGVVPLSVLVQTYPKKLFGKT